MNADLTLFTHCIKAMGSPCEFKIYTTAEKSESLFNLASERLLQLEQKYTRYQQDSITSRINGAAGTRDLIELDTETTHLLNYADVLYQQSEGLFDITSGILRRAWNFHSGKLPTQETLNALLPLIGWDKVEWNGSYFRLPLKGMEIDFGGFVKEYAADQLAQLLRDNGVNHGLVNLGGDICLIGPHPDGSAWQVGIQHPRHTGQAIVKIPMTHGAIATSGDYERFMLVDGQRYGHLLNPRTGWPIQCCYASASVIAPQCVVAGSFSSIALLKGEKNPEWLRESGLAYLLINQLMELESNIP